MATTGDIPAGFRCKKLASSGLKVATPSLLDIVSATPPDALEWSGLCPALHRATEPNPCQSRPKCGVDCEENAPVHRTPVRQTGECLYAQTQTLSCS